VFALTLLLLWSYSTAADAVHKGVGRAVDLYLHINLAVSVNVGECECDRHFIGMIAAHLSNHIQIRFGFTWIAWDFDHLNQSLVIDCHKMTDRVMAVSVSNVCVYLVGSWKAIMKTVCCSLPQVRNYA